MDSAKRVRSSNFTTNEMEVLLELVEEHKKVVECKKTDTASNREKDIVWEKITLKFNAFLRSNRTTKQLRMKWDAWKKITRKNYSSRNGNSSGNSYKTGGGPYDNSYDNWEDRILSIIGISSSGDGIESDTSNEVNEVQNVIFECDDSLINEIKEEFPKIEEQQPSTSTEEESYENENDTRIHWSPKKLEEPMHRALNVATETKGSQVTEEDLLTTAAFTFTNQLNSGLKPFHNQKYLVAAATKSKHDLLVDKKIELVSLQIELLKKEHDLKEKRNAERHEVEMQLLKEKCKCKDKV